MIEQELKRRMQVEMAMNKEWAKRQQEEEEKVRAYKEATRQKRLQKDREIQQQRQ